MEEKDRYDCPQCGFEYDPLKSEFCPNCNHGKETKNPLITLSDFSVTMPFGGKAAVLLTSCYAIFRISEMLFHLWVVNLIFVGLYLAVIYFWLSKKDIVERPIWFLILLVVIYSPILVLIYLLLFL